MKKKLSCDMFGGKDAEMYNALMSAIMDCAEGDFYKFIENTPKTSMVVFIVDRLKELGYGIN